MGLFKLMRLLRLVRVFRQILQYTEYGVAVLLLWTSGFALIAHWLSCLYFAIAILERPHLPTKVGWIDFLAAKFQMRVPFHDEDNHLDVEVPVNATGSPIKMATLDIRSQYISMLSLEIQFIHLKRI